MSQILTTAPLVEPVSLAEAKAHIRVTHNDDDTYINTLISAARRLIEQRYDLALLQQNWSVYVDCWPRDGIFKLPLFPLLAIIDVNYYGDDDVAATLDHAHYYLDGATNPSRLVLRNGRSFPAPGRRVNGIELKLTAGFGATAASVPTQIKQALLIILSDWYASRGDVDAGQIPISAQALLSTYKSVRLI
jgi:uncharacterized phiE125 gp8 family phage protein